MFKVLTKRKRTRKKGQAIIETVMVLGIHLFLIGFMITGFQLMHNKMVYSMAAYEGVRTAIAYKPGSGHDVGLAKARAQLITENQMGQTTTRPKVKVESSGDYYTCTVEAEVRFLFPLINPNTLTSKTKHKVSASFTMRKENPRVKP